jgi:hypothetical protein
MSFLANLIARNDAVWRLDQRIIYLAIRAVDQFYLSRLFQTFLLVRGCRRLWQLVERMTWLKPKNICFERMNIFFGHAMKFTVT